MNIKKSRKAQITLFVIAAAALIVIILGVFYTKDIFQKIKETGMPEQAKASRDIIDSCVEKSSKEALGIISLQGGFLAPEDYFSDGTLHIAYWYDKGQDVSPTLDSIKSELSNLMNVIIDSCVNSGLQGIQGINFTTREPVTKTEIKTDYLLMNTNYPVTIIVGDKNYRFEDFSAKLNARLGKIYELSRLIVNEQTKHPDSLCLTCLSDIGIENDINITIGARNETLAVDIIDENSKALETLYEFRLAMRV